ncbi:plasmolipin isoform X2 [Betta splendens]|nr:plasmolipin isoform X2 [Betta splendens]
MADFPSKVTTETSASQAQSPQQGGNRFQELTSNITATVDMSFIQSLPAVLMMIEIGLGLIHWALIASAYYTLVPAYGWVMFVAVTLWILTTILFLMILCDTLRHLPAVPWPLTVMVYQAVAAVLYLTAFLTNAATVNHFWVFHFSYNHMAAAAFFGAAVTIAYGASAYFSYMDWRGDGGNAATTTVPT